MRKDANDQTFQLDDYFYDTEEGTNLTYTVNEAGLANVIDHDIDGLELTIDFLDDQFGAGQITIEACDTDEDCFSHTPTITVNPINDTPVLTGITTAGETAVRGYEYSFVVSPIQDVDDSEFTFIITDEPTPGGTAVSITPSGSSIYFLSVSIIRAFSCV